MGLFGKSGAASASPLGSRANEYHGYVEMGSGLKAALKTAVICPYCGASTIPDLNGCCEYCGGAVNG